MTRPSAPVPPLVAAAEDLEQTMGHYLAAVAAAEKVHLNSQKNLGRAGPALQRAADVHERMGGQPKALTDAINAARERDESPAARLEGRATEGGTRLEQLKALRERAGTIGESVRQVSDLAKGAEPK